MSNKCIGSPVFERQTFYLASGNFKSCQTDRNEILFKVTKVLGSIQAYLEVRNLGDVDSTISVKLSNTTDVFPGRDPWSLQDGSGTFIATFSEAASETIKPGAHWSVVPTIPDDTTYMIVEVTEGAAVRCELGSVTHFEQYA